MWPCLCVFSFDSCGRQRVSTESVIRLNMGLEKLMHSQLEVVVSAFTVFSSISGSMAVIA